MSFFLHIGISILLLFSKCIVATSLFYHEGGVRYQGEYFLHIGIRYIVVVFQMYSCDEFVSPWRWSPLPRWVFFTYWYKCIVVVFKCIAATSLFHYEGGVRYQGEYFLHIGISVLLLFSKCIVATSSFHHEGGVCYQGEYFLHIGISVLLFSKCIVATSLFHHEGGVCYQGEYFLHIGISVLLLFSTCNFCFNMLLLVLLLKYHCKWLYTRQIFSIDIYMCNFGVCYNTWIYYFRFRLYIYDDRVALLWYIKKQSSSFPLWQRWIWQVSQYQIVSCLSIFLFRQKWHLRLNSDRLGKWLELNTWFAGRSECRPLRFLLLYVPISSFVRFILKSFSDVTVIEVSYLCKM